MHHNITPVKRALLSVSNKEGIVEFATELNRLGVDIISTGGTSRLLKEAHIPHQLVEDVTGFPEMLEGRIKTLHPRIHGGILGRRDAHTQEAQQHGIHWIDLVIVNFYPFADATNKEMTWDEAVEYIDVGGPTMVRAAAKNCAWVGVVVNPNDYAKVIEELHQQNGLTWNTRKNLAEKVFALTARYDEMIHQYLFHQNQDHQQTTHTTCAPYLHLQLKKLMTLRYGENPHQQACAYEFTPPQPGILSATQHQGKPLSYNNIIDAEGAQRCLAEFSTPACVIVKHANPCGVAIAETIDAAYLQAYQADPVSAFGGVIALNRPCTALIAQAMTDMFVEVVLAPAYSNEALTILATKPNLRVLDLSMNHGSAWEMKFISGGVLIQTKDDQLLQEQDLRTVTKIMPSKEDMTSMLFAWQVLKHIKSNGILIAKQNVTVGIGAGQVSRIDAVDLAVRKAGNNIMETILASDAFFPFRDSIDRIAKTGIRAIIQPGGSIRDEEVIAACNEHGIAMVFTGKRCFRH